MPILQAEHIQGLIPLIYAFEGQEGKSREKNVLEGEGENELFIDLISDGKDNGYPKQFHDLHFLTEEQVDVHKINRGKNFPMYCYLWVIDNESIKILWEMTSNIKRKNSNPQKPFVCHTNITGINGQAYIGGEMYFCKNGNIYVNFSSGRFGIQASEAKKDMAIKYMIDCGYKNIVRVEFEL